MLNSEDPAEWAVESPLGYIPYGNKSPFGEHPNVCSIPPEILYDLKVPLLYDSRLTLLVLPISWSKLSGSNARFSLDTPLLQEAFPDVFSRLGLVAWACGILYWLLSFYVPWKQGQFLIQLRSPSCPLAWLQAGIKIPGRNINNLRYADDTTLRAESEDELKSLLMKVKEESEKADLKPNIQNTKITASGTSQHVYLCWQRSL